MENSMLHANLVAVCFIERELLPMEVLHCGNRNFLPFWLPWPWTRPDDLRIRTSLASPIIETAPDVRKWTSYTSGLSSYRIGGGECVHVVTLGHFRSRDKDGCHTSCSAVVENSVLHANLMALSSIEPELWAIEVYIVGIGTFSAPVILTLTRWPSHTNLTRIAWSYTGCANMNFLYVNWGFRKSDRRTCIHTVWFKK